MHPATLFLYSTVSIRFYMFLHGCNGILFSTSSGIDSMFIQTSDFYYRGVGFVVPSLRSDIVSSLDAIMPWQMLARALATYSKSETYKPSP